MTPSSKPPKSPKAPKNPVDVVVAGHICLDVIPHFPFKRGEVAFEDIFRPGKLTQMGEVVMSSGGPVSNTGINLRTLGMKVELMGKVGDDFFAKGLLELLAQRGLDKSMVRVAGEQTSYTIVLAPPGIDRMFLHCPGTNNTYGADDVNYEVVGRSRHFHLGYPPLMKRLYENDGAELTEIFRRIKERHPHVSTSLDMALPDPAAPSGRVDWRKVLERTIPYLDLFLPSAEEMLFMLEREEFMARHDRARREGRALLDSFTAEDLTRLGGRLLDLGAKVAVIKCGWRGIYGRTASREVMAKIPNLGADRLDDWSARELWHGTFLVDPVASATGSGDSAIAGFIASFLRGCAFERSLQMANAVGACNVTAMDALSGIKPWEDTESMVEAGWRPQPTEKSVEGRGWKNVRPLLLWTGPNESKIR